MNIRCSGGFDYFIHQGGDRYAYTSTGDVPDDGIFRVQSGYDYTNNSFGGRVDGVNGIDDNYLHRIGDFSYISDVYNGQTAYRYDLDSYNLDASDGVFVGFAPWCGNDVIGGSTPVPEPATMFLFGSGLVGLCIKRKIRK